MLNEQRVARSPDVDLICFTDDAGLSSDTWTIRHVRPIFPSDPVRSQRFLKICAHRAVPEYDASLYIDNSVILRRPGRDVIRAMLRDADTRIAAVEHSFRETVADEFDEVVSLDFDARYVCREQSAHYRQSDPDSLKERPLWTGIMARRHLDPAVIGAMELWWAHVLRYSHRDQLSVWVALRESRVQPTIHLLDNHESDIHVWPVAKRRDSSRGGTSAARRIDSELGQLKSDLGRAATELDDATRRQEALERELRTITATRTWRWSAPLRAARGRIASMRARRVGGTS
jgi:hypothetical protein